MNVRARSALRLVSFDAGWTLFQIAEPVGATYARLARDAGIAVDAGALEEGFRRAFAAAPPLVAPPGQPGDLLEFERGWWRAVVEASLQHALGELPAAQEGARGRFFDLAFEHYAHAAAWRLYPEVRSVLAELRGRGLVLVVVSNFDRRLHRLLDELGLGDAFAVAVASSEAGASKPDPAIFARVLGQLGGIPAEACVHVGDSLGEDVAGALAAGWQGVWLDRRGGQLPAAARGTPRITSLADLPAWLQSSLT